MAKEFKYTAIQEEAMKLAGSGATDIMLFGGSRSGKTFILCCMIGLVLQFNPDIRVVILRKQLKDVRESVVMDTWPKVMRLRFNWPRNLIEKCINRNDMIFRHPNGSELWFAGLDDKERVEKILGKEYGLIYFNECSQIPYSSVEIAKTRLAQRVEGWRNKCFYDCNPPSKNHWTYRIFQQGLNPDKTPLAFPQDYVSMKMNPTDNTENISEDYLNRTLAGLKGKSRERFLLGNWIDDNDKALWHSETMIDPYRVTEIPSDLNRIVIGVDPAVTSSKSSDYTGIVVAGKKWEPEDECYHYYVLGEHSMQGSPNQWASLVANLYRRYMADKIVAEVNQGGDMVINTIRNVDSELPVKSVRATRGKIIRAEPIAALYEKGLVHHVGCFSDLETEMTSFTGDKSEESPDRMDALVWALTDLAENNKFSIRRFSLN